MMCEHSRAGMAEPLIISLRNCPVSFLGDKRETILLRVEKEPKNRDELIAAAEEALGFPLCENDEARAAVLTQWSVEPIFSNVSEPTGAGQNPLQFCCSDESLDYIKRILTSVPIPEKSKGVFGEKLLQTLSDRQQHSFVFVVRYNDKGIIVSVRTHPARYLQVAKGCHGQFGSTFHAVTQHVPVEQLSGMLCLDYFIEDADQTQAKNVYLHFAVNWFPLKLEGVPPGCESAIVQLEMFPEREWLGLQQLFRGNAPVIRALNRAPVTASSRTPHIFLSHNSEDKPTVRRLAQSLNQLGIDAWLDEWELEVGDSLRRSVGAALEKSQYVGVIITPAFLQSEWCMRELDQALAREQRQRAKLVIPLLFGVATPPPFVEGRLYLDFYRDFFSSLTRLCGFIYGASPKVVTSVLAEKHPTSLDEVRTLVRRFGWQNYSFVEKTDFEKLRQQVARLGLELRDDELVLTSDIVNRLRQMGVEVAELDRLIG
jgi:TIR domain